MSLFATAHANAGVIYTEVGDAGELIGTAQTVTGATGTLDAIRGNLTAGADLFKIILTGGQAFSATTTSSSLAFNDFDTELFLFDSTGKGLFANDDSTDSPPQSTITGFTPSVTGTYFLAIAGAGYLPTSSGGQIFASSGGFLTAAGTPTGPGGAFPLSGWTSVSSESGLYEIRLTGASIINAAAVPEPGSYWMLGAGLFAMAIVRSPPQGGKLSGPSSEPKHRNDQSSAIRRFRSSSSCPIHSPSP